mmetsp:Transcript_106812/g.297343  ORF Transcript_106812/g.297343 Transcript_106812/m.297343 type:complete len:485 (-) Transcript_106812:148-1602(-)
MRPLEGIAYPHHKLVRNIVILACAVDAADKAMLPATFKALSLQMGVGAKELGALTFAQSIAFSLALPVWGLLLCYLSARRLLVLGCCIWGTSTLCIAFTTSFWQQFLLRLVNGAALAAMNPVGQAVLCDVVPEAERGKAFGLLQSASAGLVMLVGAGATTSASGSIAGLAGWRVAHIGVSAISLSVAFLLHQIIPPAVSDPPKPSSASWLTEQREVVRLIFSKPSFVILVIQGVTGGIPWNSFAFLPLFFQLSGYTDLQAGQVLLYGGIGGAIGGYIGGLLGDHFDRLFPGTGRVATAQASVLLGIVLFLAVMYTPPGKGNLFLVSTAYFLFNLTACWTPAAACRPICGTIFRDSRDRAQVLALWIALEGIASAVLGAPLTGMLSEALGFRLVSGGVEAGTATADGLDALRSALVGTALIPWALCSLAWVPMYWALPRDRYLEERSLEQENAADELSSLGGNPLPRHAGHPHEGYAVCSCARAN